MTKVLTEDHAREYVGENTVPDSKEFISDHLTPSVFLYLTAAATRILFPVLCLPSTAHFKDLPNKYNKDPFVLLRAILANPQ